MPTEIAVRLHNEIDALRSHTVRSVDTPETRFPWPTGDKRIWPQADVSGSLANGDLFVIEIGDHADPAHSVAKYWPFLEAVHRGDIECSRVHYVAISSPDATSGQGCEYLADFIGGQFEQKYVRLFRYIRFALAGQEPADLAKSALEFFQQGLGAK